MANEQKSLEIAVSYDSRFNGLMLQGKVGEDIFPASVIGLRDILAKVPPYEVEAALMPEYQETEKGGTGIDPARLRLLEETDWKGKVVLDIGGYDGFAAEIAHKGGAKRAICLDNQQYLTYGWDTKKKEGVEYITGDIMEWKEPVDKVILFNVLYHVKDMWHFLEHVRSITKEEMLLCTLFRYHPGSWVYLYDEFECNPTDASVFWGPSIEALERILRFTGWEAEKYALSYDRVLYRCKPILEPQFRQSEY